MPGMPIYLKEYSGARTPLVLEIAMDGTIILMDYSSYERQKVKHILDKIGSFEVIEVSSLNQFKLLDISMERLRLVIADISLPSEAQGFEALKLLRDKRAGDDIPVIIATRTDKPEHKAEALKYSVNDYVVKPYQVKRLENSIRSLVRLKSGFNYDTAGLGEIKMSFDDYVSREIKYSKRANNPLSFILITALRLDGSNAASLKPDPPDDGREEVFAIAAEKARKALRATDTIVMNKDRDIIIVLPGTNEEGAGLVCEKIKTAIFQELEKAKADRADRIYAVSITYPKDGEDFQALMETAFKKVSDKEMLEKITSIPAETRKYADKTYSKYNRWF
jgi:PleD family two-component response regulator